MKICIAGCGIVGFMLAERLSKEGHDVTVMDIDEERLLQAVNSFDVLTVHGDAISVGTLEETGVGESDLLIAVTESDEKNLIACFLAKKMGVKNTIARIKNVDIADSVNLVKDDIGLSMMVNPELETAREILRALKYRSAGQVETFANGTVEVLTSTVKKGSAAENKKLIDLDKAANAKVLIFGVKRQGEIFIPNGRSELMADDVVSFVASPSNSRKFLRCLGSDTDPVNDIVIVGGSKLGRYLATLADQSGVQVKLIDKHEENCKEIHSLVPEAEIICGDATDMTLIEEEGILNAAAIVTATENDSTNLMISMFVARNAPNCKLMTKVKKSDFNDMIMNLNVGSVYNPKYIGAEHILNYVNAMQNTIDDEAESSCHVMDNSVEVLEFVIKKDMPHLNEPLMSIKFKDNLIITAISRNGKSLIPGGSDEMKVGDRVLVATTLDEIRGFADIFM